MVTHRELLAELRETLLKEHNIDYSNQLFGAVHNRIRRVTREDVLLEALEEWKQTHPQEAREYEATTEKPFRHAQRLMRNIAFPGIPKPYPEPAEAICTKVMEDMIIPELQRSFPHRLYDGDDLRETLYDYARAKSELRIPKLPDHATRLALIEGFVEHRLDTLDTAFAEQLDAPVTEGVLDEHPAITQAYPDDLLDAGDYPTAQELNMEWRRVLQEQISKGVSSAVDYLIEEEEDIAAGIQPPKVPAQSIDPQSSEHKGMAKRGLQPSHKPQHPPM